MDLKQLEYFVRVAELGSFSKAAASLHIAQPALSRQVRQLESELDEHLLIRNGRGVVTTSAGEKLLDHGRGILRQVERARSDIMDARSGRPGRVAIGMPPTVAKRISTPLIMRLGEEERGANITVVQGRSAQLQEWLWSGRIDMAIMFNAPASPLLEARELLATDLLLIGPADPEADTSPVEAERLADFPMIIPSRPNTIRTLVDSTLAKTMRQLNILFEVDSMETSYELVARGYGYSIRTGRSIRRQGLKGVFAERAIVDPPLMVRTQLVMSARRPFNSLHDRAARMLEDACMESYS
jgi:LysR family nitrogen assimilation transcriptional regulator